MKISQYMMPLGAIIVLLGGSYLTAGMYGAITVLVLGMIALPFYLLLDLYDFNIAEKIIFAFFLSIGLYSTLVYWINQILPSYRLSLIISYIILIGTYVGLRFFKR